MWRSAFVAALGVCALSATLRAEPLSINFADTSAGLQDGSLRKQNSLAVNAQAPGNGDFVFVSGSGVLLKPNTGGDHGYAYLFTTGTDTPEGRDTFEPGLAQSISVNFQITEKSPSAKKSVIGLGWGIFLPVSSNCLPFHLAFLRDTEAGGYKLQILKEEKAQLEGDVPLIIPASALGLDPAAGKTTSNPLQLSLTLTNQGDKGEWSTVGQLTNLTTHQTFDLKNTITKASYYKLDHLIRTVLNPRRAEDDGLGDVVITALDAEVTPAPPTQ